MSANGADGWEGVAILAAALGVVCVSLIGLAWLIRELWR